MRTPIDLTLYLVTDRPYMAGRAMDSVVLDAVRGGVTVVQLREKTCPAREFVQLARDLKKKLTPLGVPLIVNDRIDVAMAGEADGVHLGPYDIPYPEARRVMGPGAIIGVSVENWQEFEEAQGWEDLDYVAISPVWSTPTKRDTGPAWGLAGLQEACRRSRHPVVAIGGINESNIRAVRDAGAQGVAVVSAICAAADPEAAARALVRAGEDTHG